MFSIHNIQVNGMVKYVVAKQVTGKKIITNEGEDFGRVVDLRINEVTGQITDLIVDPNPDNNVSKLRKEKNNVLLPFSSVIAVGDYIIIDKRHIFE